MRSKELRCYGHVGRQADDRMSKHRLFGPVKRPGHISQLRNNIVLSDIHNLSSSCLFQDARQTSTWRAQTCSTCTSLWPEGISNIIIIMRTQTGAQCVQCESMRSGLGHVANLTNDSISSSCFFISSGLGAAGRGTEGGAGVCLPRKAPPGPPFRPWNCC